MTQEALKMALYYLEQSDNYLGSLDHSKPIAAIKKALAQPDPYKQGYADAMNWKVQNHLEHLPTAQPEQETPKGWKSEIWKSVKQQEQEPVAWRNAALRVGEDLCSVGPFGYYDMTAEEWLDWALSVVTVHAPPPQRTWVGLTDEEYAELAEEFGPFPINQIEAKLKEKNT